MNTFLPYPDFLASAKCLDRKRLGKQRVETLQLLRGQWANHPAARMWAGYEFQLGCYGLVVCQVWREYGYKDTCLEKIHVEMQRFVDTGLPPWFGSEEFHLAQRSNLCRKDPAFYGALWADVPPNLAYVW